MRHSHFLCLLSYPSFLFLYLSRYKFGRITHHAFVRGVFTWRELKDIKLSWRNLFKCQHLLRLTFGAVTVSFLGTKVVLWCVLIHRTATRSACEINWEVSVTAAAIGFFDTFKASCEAEIADLDRAVIIDKDVCWFQITVNDLGLVQIVDSTEHIVDNGLHLFLL